MSFNAGLLAACGYIVLVLAAASQEADHDQESMYADSSDVDQTEALGLITLIAWRLLGTEYQQQLHSLPVNQSLEIGAGQHICK